MGICIVGVVFIFVKEFLLIKIKSCKEVNINRNNICEKKGGE